MFLRLFLHCVRRAAGPALRMAGIRNAARTTRIPRTTNTSITLKALGDLDRSQQSPHFADLSCMGLPPFRRSVGCKSVSYCIANCLLERTAETSLSPAAGD